MRSTKVWRLLGVAGLAGVAATGVVVARDQRRRSTLGADEVRARLHERLAQADGAERVDGAERAD